MSVPPGLPQTPLPLSETVSPFVVISINEFQLAYLSVFCLMGTCQSVQILLTVFCLTVSLLVSLLSGLLIWDSVSDLFCLKISLMNFSDIFTENPLDMQYVTFVTLDFCHIENLSPLTSELHLLSSKAFC